jgi:hypothetical protein
VGSEPSLHCRIVVAILHRRTRHLALRCGLLCLVQYGMLRVARFLLHIGVVLGGERMQSLVPVELIAQLILTTLRLLTSPSFWRFPVVKVWKLLFVFILNLFQRILFMRTNGFHIAKLLSQSSQHLLGNLELNCTWVVLNCKRILTEILYEHGILRLVLVLTHLEHHVFVTPELLCIHWQCIWIWIIAETASQFITHGRVILNRL